MAHQLSSKPTFTCIFKCHPRLPFPQKFEFLHSPHHSLTVKLMVHFCGWDSTASKLETLRGGTLLFTTKFPEIPGTHSIRGVWPQQHYRCPASSNAPNINHWNILSILDKTGKKYPPNGNHYIFSTDLTRLTKMFSLSCIYLHILNMYGKTASYRRFPLYFFFP